MFYSYLVANKTGDKPDVLGFIQLYLYIYTYFSLIKRRTAEFITRYVRTLKSPYVSLIRVIPSW